MPQQVEQKTIDPEAELSNVQRMYKKLAPMCSVEKRAGGEPQLAPQEKQLGILTNELKETLLCINLASKGQHALRDNMTKKGTKKSIIEYEQLELEVGNERRQQAELDCLNYLATKQMQELLKKVPTEADVSQQPDNASKKGTKKSMIEYEQLELEVANERRQQAELDCLNYLATKQVQELLKKVPTEADELAMIEDAANRLRRMENRLDLATKRFCVVNTDNKMIREEIHRLMVERESFNIQWNRTIGKLVKGKEYLMDIFEIAAIAFGDRDECIRKLGALKWKGLYQLNRDIAEMQSYEGELNHLAKLEEFLRVKGSRRICEADEKEEIKRQEEVQRCEMEIARHDALLEEIFKYAGTSRISSIVTNFETMEIQNFSVFVLLCEVLQEYIFVKADLNRIRQLILDQRDMNEAREEMQTKRLVSERLALDQQRTKVQAKRDLNTTADNTIHRVLRGIDDLVKVARCDITPLLSLLGNHREATKWNVAKFLRILEAEVKSLIEVVYGAVKPPAPTPKGRKVPEVAPVKLVADPYVKPLRPNRIENLVPYKPCAYCVEDYIMNLIFETLAVPADRAYVETIFHLEDINTKFGIYTLTNPAKRHPYRERKS